MEKHLYIVLHRTAHRWWLFSTPLCRRGFVALLCNLKYKGVPLNLKHIIVKALTFYSLTGTILLCVWNDSHDGKVLFLRLGVNFSFSILAYNLAFSAISPPHLLQWCSLISRHFHFMFQSLHCAVTVVAMAKCMPNMLDSSWTPSTEFDYMQCRLHWSVTETPVPHVPHRKHFSLVHAFCRGP